MLRYEWQFSPSFSRKRSFASLAHPSFLNLPRLTERERTGCREPRPTGHNHPLPRL